MSYDGKLEIPLMYILIYLKKDEDCTASVSGLGKNVKGKTGKASVIKIIEVIT